jgi:hypothetical protein
VVNTSAQTSKAAMTVTSVSASKGSTAGHSRYHACVKAEHGSDEGHWSECTQPVTRTTSTSTMSRPGSDSPQMLNQLAGRQRDGRSSREENKPGSKATERNDDRDGGSVLCGLITRISTANEGEAD